MKNNKLKGLASKLSNPSQKDYEILNPELEMGIKGGLSEIGGLTCFNCGEFKCNGFTAKSKELSC